MSDVLLLLRAARARTCDASTGVSVSARQIAPPIANAYVRAIGEKMTPETPVIVKSGRNATPMMSVENVIGPATSRAPARMRSLIVPFPCGPEVAEDVLHHDDGRVDDDAEVDRAERDQVRRRARRRPCRMNAMSSARGMLSAVMSAARHVPEEEEEHDGDEGHPDEQVLEHGVRRQLARARRGRSTARSPSPAAGCGSAGCTRRACRSPRACVGVSPAVAHEDDALHDVGLVVVPDDAQARRVPDVHVGRRP